MPLRARAADAVGRAVPCGAADRVAEQVVGGVDARHAARSAGPLRGIAGGPVGVMLPRQLPPAPLDAVGVRVVAHVEDLVRVAAEARRGHHRRGYHAARLHRARAPIVRPMRLPFQPPIEPMLAKLADATSRPATAGCSSPSGTASGRSSSATATRSTSRAATSSRSTATSRSCRRRCAANLPERCVLDGEIVIAGDDGLDFEALLLRIHPAASRVAMLAEQTPASFVAWDLLALGDEDLRGRPQAERRARLETRAGRRAAARPPDARDARPRRSRTTGSSASRAPASTASSPSRVGAPYQPGKRAMLKIKHARTADCVVAGFRWHKNGPGTHVGSLLLGPVRRRRACCTTSASRRRSSWPQRAELAHGARAAARRTRSTTIPGASGPSGPASAAADASGTRMPGATSRWNRGKDLSWEPLRAERVAEVAYDHLQGDRFRHATTFRRWRPDKQPADCRYDQLEETPAVRAAAHLRRRDSRRRTGARGRARVNSDRLVVRARVAAWLARGDVPRSADEGVREG